MKERAVRLRRFAHNLGGESHGGNFLFESAVTH
jgi:hypothetical protein